MAKKHIQKQNSTKPGKSAEPHKYIEKDQPVIVFPEGADDNNQNELHDVMKNTMEHTDSDGVVEVMDGKNLKDHKKTQKIKLHIPSKDEYSYPLVETEQGVKVRRNVGRREQEKQV